MKRIITIGREFGSGGREVGRRLAERLNIAYYDREIIDELMKRTQLAESYVLQVEESRPLPLLPITTARTFGIPTNYTLENRLSIYKQEIGVCRSTIFRRRKRSLRFIRKELEALEDEE